MRAEQKRERSEKHQYKPITCVHKTRGIRRRIEKKTRATLMYVKNRKLSCGAADERATYEDPSELDMESRLAAHTSCER